MINKNLLVGLAFCSNTVLFAGKVTLHILPAATYINKAKKIMNSRVTYGFSGGRFGDNLVSYAHARWVSFKYKLPFVYRPFTYSDELMMHIKHPHSGHIDESTFTQLNNVGLKEFDKAFFSPKERLWIVPYFGEGIYMNLYLGRTHFLVDWENPEFRQILKQEIKSVNPIPALDLPKDRITIAVHVRTGGGFDRVISRARLSDDQRLPLKFPSDSYYITAIKNIANIYKGKLLQVHLFTDSPDPKTLLEKYSQQINNANITYSCREADNGHNTNVLEDFFALTEFDCLIRAESNFSIMAEKIADFKVIISPIERSKRVECRVFVRKRQSK